MENFYKKEFESFDAEFGIHFKDSKGELEFCHEWIKEHDERIKNLYKKNFIDYENKFIDFFSKERENSRETGNLYVSSAYNNKVTTIESGKRNNKDTRPNQIRLL